MAKKVNFFFRVETGWIGLNPILLVKKRVESGWYLRDTNRGGSGWPSGSKIGLGAGRVGRVDLAALIQTESNEQLTDDTNATLFAKHKQGIFQKE